MLDHPSYLVLLVLISHQPPGPSPSSSYQLPSQGVGQTVFGQTVFGRNPDGTAYLKIAPCIAEGPLGTKMLTVLHDYNTSKQPQL